MNTEKKELYVQPALVKHELLRDITANASGKGNCGFGNGGRWCAGEFGLSRGHPLTR